MRQTRSEDVKANKSDASPGWGSGTFAVENQLPCRVRVHGDRGHLLTMAPLERRTIEADALAPFDREKMAREDQLFVAEQSKAERDSSAIVGLMVLALPLYLYIGFQLDNPLFWFGIPALAFLGALAAWARVKRGWTEVQRWAKQAMSLLLVAVLAVGLPAAVIWYSAGLDDAAREASSIGDALGTSPQFLARSLQLLFIAAASLLPALMYFVFDREQLGTLRDRFIQQVFRLDPSLKRLADMRAKYGPQIEEMYGPMRRATRARLLGGRLSPIVVATLLLTVGWTLTLLNTDVVPGANGEFPILSLFEPDASVVTFAFLGAYFFAIQLVLRSYLRGDLRPKTYGHIAVRLLIVVILAWVLQEIVGEQTNWLRAAVFVAGIVPETALRWIRELVRGRGPEWIKGGEDSNLTEPHPLSNLEGIDLYDLTRLTEEGVTNVEALAHHEFVDLVLKTRIPAPRLVDWVDQAILYLHARGDSKNAGDVPADTLWSRLQVYGIRTATDLQDASSARPESERGSFFKLLGKDEGPPYRVQVILDTLEDDEWLGYIRHWRRYSSFQSLVDIHAEHSRDPAAAAGIDQVIDVEKGSVVRKAFEAMGAALAAPEARGEGHPPKQDEG